MIEPYALDVQSLLKRPYPRGLATPKRKARSRVRTGALPPWGGATLHVFEPEHEQTSRIVHREMEAAIYAPKPGEATGLAAWLPPDGSATFFLGVDRTTLKPLTFPTFDEFLARARREVIRLRGPVTPSSGA